MASTTDFDLVPVNGRLTFTDSTWDTARFHILAFQSAQRVALVGEPPSAIRVTAYWDVAEVAPAILARLSELAGVELRLVVTPASVRSTDSSRRPPATGDRRERQLPAAHPVRPCLEPRFDGCPAVRHGPVVAGRRGGLGEAGTAGFTDLTVRTPCCGVTTSLDDLSYDWPAGFARAGLSVLNLGRGWPADSELAEVAAVFGHPLTQVLTHY